MSGRFEAGKFFARITVIGTASVNSMINAMTRVAQPNPICGWSLWNTIGYITPPEALPVSHFSKSHQRIQHLPSELPAAAIPVANALRLMKYCGITATPGSNMPPKPIPTASPCARTTCLVASAK
jgi:hypothetical protein